MSRSPLAALIDRSCKCMKCGAAMGQCDCWDRKAEKLLNQIFTNPRRQTLYGRATPAQRQKMRQFALSQPCRDCGAKIGEKCRGSAGKPAAPHWIRRKDWNK